MISVIDIEHAIVKLPKKDKRKLFRDLAEHLEDAWESLLLEKSLQEGDTMPYERYRKRRFKK